MPRGGYRPGSGRKKGKSGPRAKSQSEIEREQIRAQIRAITADDLLARGKIYQTLKKKIAQGETLNSTDIKTYLALSDGLITEVRETVDIEGHNPEDADGLKYLKEKLADPTTDEETKIRIAGMIIPYQHPRKGEGVGKKEDKQDRAKAVGGGMYASMSNRLKVVK